MRSIQKSSKCVLGVFFSLLLFLSFAFVSPLHAEILDVVDSQETTDVFLYVGDLVTVKVYSLTRIAVGNPGIVDINSVTADEIVLVGRKVGETSVYVWDEFGKKKITARVFAEDLGVLADELPKVLAVKGFKGLSVEKDYYLGKVVVSGSLPKADKKRLDEILKSSEDTIRNYVQEESDLIQIDVQISELSTTLTKTLGIDWRTSTGNLAPQWKETLPSATGKFKDLFKIGDFNRTTAILNTVNLLIQEGKGRILSKPSFVVTTGEEASFLVGGEVPIPTTTTTSSGGGTTATSVAFKPYGIELRATPTIKEGKISIELEIATREVDRSNQAADGSLAFITRSVNTSVLLDDNQTVVLAGLIKQDRGETVRKVPFLSSIPVVGLLFRNKTTPSNSDLELVVSLTPKILKKPAVVEEAQKEEMEVMEELPVSDVEEDTTMPKEAEVAEEVVPMDEALVGEEPAAVEMADEKSAVETTPLAEVAPMEAAPPAAEDSAAPPAPAEESAEIPSEPPPVVEAPAPEPDSEAVKQYTEKVGTQIAQAISYPYEAKEYGWTGTAVLNITILNDGNVKDVSIKASSGHAVFDKDAVNTAKILSPYDPLPSDWNSKEISISVPVVYSEKPVLESAP